MLNKIFFFSIDNLLLLLPLEILSSEKSIHLCPQKSPSRMASCLL